MRLSWASYDIQKRSYDPLNFAIIGYVNWIIIGFWFVARVCNVRLYTGFDMDGHIYRLCPEKNPPYTHAVSVLWKKYKLYHLVTCKHQWKGNCLICQMQLLAHIIPLSKSKIMLISVKGFKENVEYIVTCRVHTNFIVSSMWYFCDQIASYSFHFVELAYKLPN